MIGIDKNEVIEYVLTDEKDDQGKPKDGATIFLIGNISNRDKSRLFMGAISPGGKVDVEKLLDKCVDIVKAGLRGIKGIAEKKSGNRIDVDKIDDEAVDLIPFEYLVEIMGAIVDHNFITEAEEKK